MLNRPIRNAHLSIAFWESRTAQTCRNMISTLWLSCHYLKTSSLLKILLKNRGTSTSTFRRTDWRFQRRLKINFRYNFFLQDLKKKGLDNDYERIKWKIAVKSTKNRQKRRNRSKMEFNEIFGRPVLCPE